jgi:serine protease Do
MRLKRVCFVFLLSFSIIQQSAEAGILKTLEGELEALVSKTESYLVTVRGDGGWRNLVATGIVIDASGYLITSSQVYEATGFEVTFKNGVSYHASKVGVDNLTGTAVLKIQNGKFDPPTWDQTKTARKGSWITVVGNSYNVPSTVYFGSMVDKTDEGLFRLAVNVNPGASGGAVLDLDGNLIGILVARESSMQGSDSAYWMSPDPGTAMLLRSLGASNGRCYAMPLDAALDIATRLIRDGTIVRGYLGIASKNQQVFYHDGETVGRGVRITSLEDDSPAVKAGLQKNDIILSMNSRPITNRASLISAIRANNPGDSISIEYFRQNQKYSTVAILTEVKETPFASGLELPQQLPASAVGLKKPPPITAKNYTGEIARLQASIRKLQAEVDELKKSNAQ